MKTIINPRTVGLQKMMLNFKNGKFEKIIIKTENGEINSGLKEMGLTYVNSMKSFFCSERKYYDSVKNYLIEKAGMQAPDFKIEYMLGLVENNELYK